MKELIQKIANAFGFSVHKKGTVDALISDLKTLRASADIQEQRIEALERDLKIYKPVTHNGYFVRDAFRVTEFSSAALQKLIDDYQFQTVIDVGAGALEHSEIFAAHGKSVTAVDFGVSVYYQKKRTISGNEIDLIIGDFNNINFENQYDCVWASHILEHQTNVEEFINKIVSLTKEGGVIAITVPPFKHEIVGGHVSLWNAGMILYRLVLAGVDCSDAAILAYGYNISVIVRKREAGEIDGIEFDRGDIRRIRRYFPKELEFNSNEFDDPFNGNIARMNW